MCLVQLTTTVFSSTNDYTHLGISDTAVGQGHTIEPESRQTEDDVP